MKRDTEGKKIKTEHIGARIPTENAFMLKDNIHILGYSDITNFLWSITTEACEKIKGATIEGCDEIISKKEEEKKQADEIIQKYSSIRANLLNFKKIKEETMQMEDFPMSKAYIEALNEEMKTFGAEEMIKNLLESITDCLTDDNKMKIEIERSKIKKLASAHGIGMVCQEDFLRYIKHLKWVKDAKPTS